MSTVFSRNKEKRPRSSTSKSNNSFVKNVTSRVSGLLPATITKWFSSPSSSNTNGTSPAADVTDSSTEDEAPESPVSSQPPAKRMRFSTPGKSTRFGSADANSVSRNMDNKDLPTLPYNTVQSPPGRNTFRRETNFVSTPVRSNEEVIVEKVEKDTQHFKAQHTVSGLGKSVVTKRKSLFEALTPSDSSKVKSTMNTTDQRLPYFKPALLGSPFYHGRTMYGGAAASYMNEPNIKQRKVACVNESNNNDTATMSHSTRRIMDLLENYSSPLTEAKRIPHYVKTPRSELVKSTNKNAENNKINPFKMQELHVPGIASIMRFKQKSRLMDSTSAARQLMASYSSTAEYNPYPQSSHNTTQKDNNSKETSNLTTKVKARVTRQLRGDSANEAPPPPIQLPNIVLKIDTLPKFTLEKSVTASVAPAAIVPPVTLTPSTAAPIVSAVTAPTLVTPALKADTVSTTSSTSTKMSATSAAISSVFSTPYYITVCPTSSSSSTSNTEITSNNNPFKFSSPVKVSSETTENCKTPPKFAFGSPDRSIDRPKEDDKKLDSAVVSVKETTKLIDNSNDWKCSECWVTNKPNVDKCVCCSNKRVVVTAETPTKCSVCKLGNSQPNADKCINCEKLQSNSTGVNKLKSDSKLWKCGECWVNNEESADKCVCCGANNPNPNVSDSKSGEHIWKCFICWVTNKNDEDNCSTCGNSRKFASFNKTTKCSVCMLTDSQPNSNKCVNCDKVQPKIIDIGVSKPTDKPQWKCDGCWVNNEETAEKCVCCGAANPKNVAVGTESVKNSTEPSNKDWKCDECWITNKSHVEKCDACGSNRPGSKTTTASSTFKFGVIASSPFKSADHVFKKTALAQKESKWECTSCLVKNDNDKTICICCGADKEKVNDGIKPFNFGKNTNSTFKFGINNDNENNNVTTMEHTSMGDELAIDECETNNNVVEKIPTFTFVLPTKKSDGGEINENKTEAPKINFNFGIPKQTNKLPATNNLFEFNKTPDSKPNLQEVPKVEVTSAAPTLIKPIPVLFTPPPANTAAPTPEVLALLGSETTKVPAKSSPSLSKPVSQTSQSENKFTFSASGLKAGMNMFSSPVSVNAVSATTHALFPSPQPTSITTTALAPIPMFQKPENTTTSTVTMFTNKDATTTSTMSLFQPNKLVTTTASQPTIGTGAFFSFGTNTPAPAQPSAEKPKFNFQFGMSNKPETPAVFKPTFGSLGDNNTNKFSLPSGNLLIGGNGLSNNPLGGANGLSSANPLTSNMPTGNILGNNNGLTLNHMPGGNGLQTSSSIPGNLFGSPVVKENMWSTNNNNNSNNNNSNNNNNSASNIFVSNGNTNMLQKPATFTFGSSSPFNNNSTPTFGSNTQATQNIFGMPQNNAQSTLFPAPSSQTAPTVFGSPPQSHVPSPSMGGMFGTPNVSATPTFGTMNQPIQSFETPSMPSTPGPAFNFGSPQPSGVFGFGQQQVPQQSGVYSFGATGGAAPQVQFNMGSAPNTTQRRVRKAVRRHPQR